MTMPIEETTLSGTLQAGGGIAPPAEGSKKDDSEMTMNARIVVISVSGDLAEQYIPIMNCIFAAQRKVCSDKTWMPRQMTNEGNRKSQLISARSQEILYFYNRRQMLRMEFI